MTDPITPARLRETLDRALADYIPGINCAVHFVSIEQVDMLAEFYLHTRADLSDALLREAMEVLGKLHHAVCGETGFAHCVRLDSGMAYPWPALNDADETARATLAKLRSHMGGNHE